MNEHILSGESLDIAAQRKQELKQLFPGIFTEIKNNQKRAQSAKSRKSSQGALAIFYRQG